MRAFTLHRRHTLLVGVVALSVLLPITVAAADGPVAARTERVSVDATGGLPDAAAAAADVSDDGRYVTFASSASDLVTPSPWSGTPVTHIYVHDRLLGNNELISVDSFENPADLGGTNPAISGNGRYVVFDSFDPGLTNSDGNGTVDVFVRDRVQGTTTLVSSDADGNEGDDQSFAADISDDGRYVAFMSSADNLIPNDNGQQSIYRKDRVTGGIDKASRSTFEIQNNAGALGAAISGNGRYVAFQSEATNLILYDNNDHRDVFRRDFEAGNTALISRPNDPGPTNGDSGSASLSDDGRFVVFQSTASNLVAGEEADAFTDVFVRDTTNQSTERVSVTTAGVKGNANSTEASISDDGDRVAFATLASNLGAPTGEGTVVLRDRSAGTTAVIAGAPEAGIPAGGWYPEVSGNGRYVVFDNSLVDAVELGRVYIRILADNTFPDVATTHPFFEEVSWLVDAGLTTGYADGTYKPAFTLTRQTTAAFLYRDAGEPPFVPPGTPTFTDIPTSHPFYKEIEWAAAEGIVTGLPDGTFRPTTVVTRGAIAAFLYRAAGDPPFGEPATPTFTDVGLEHLFFTEIEWAANEGIVTGFANGTYQPGDAVTRQSMAAFLFRAEWAGA